LIRFAAAPCGAGKTNQIIKRACGLARAGERVLVLQPTKELIERTIRDELLTLSQPPRHHVFHGDVVKGAVASAITKHFKDAGPDGPLLPDSYELLLDNVARKIEDAGYSIKRGKKARVGLNGRSGLDESMRSPTSMFYLPCQAIDPRDSFFIDYNGPGREVLNPLPWIENSVVPMIPNSEPPPWPESPRADVNDALVQQATSEWRAAPEHQGNREFFRFAVRLRRAGLSPHEIETTLNAESVFGRSPRERRAQVKSIMASLRRSRRR
jgi:hypothetical protein